MSAYTVTFTDRAARELDRLDAAVAARIVAKLEVIAADPTGHPATQGLRGRDGRRLRVGDWRV